MKNEISQMCGHLLRWSGKYYTDEETRSHFNAGGLFILFCMDKGRVPNNPEELDKYADQFYPNS